jgi:hypothetical protein
MMETTLRSSSIQYHAVAPGNNARLMDNSVDNGGQHTHDNKQSMPSTVAILT